MTTTYELPSRTIHLPTQPAPQTPETIRQTTPKGLRLIDLQAGETARILRVSLADTSCRKRFAELGLAEGMKVTIASTGDTLMLIIGGGSRMGISARCADEIFVSRMP